MKFGKVFPILPGLALSVLLHQHGFTCLIRLIEGTGGFRRHVIFIVFRKHLICAKNAILRELSLGYHALAFLEQIGKNARVYDWDDFCGIRYHEVHRHAIMLPLDASFLHESADTKALAYRRFVVCYLGGAEEEDQVALECIQNQYRSNA